MRRKFHMCLNISGALENAKDLKGCITVDEKVLTTVKEIKDFLREQLTMGREVLPIGECDNFDFHTGCKGHEIEV